MDPRKKRILIADDEPNLRVLVQATLEDPEFEIVEAADGPEALRLARERAPDLLLLDWMMPGMSGIEVTRALRADAATRDVSIILLTARGQEEDRRQARDLQVSAHLVKPFSPLELLKRVHEILA